MGKGSNVMIKGSNVFIKGSNVGVSRQEESRRLYEAYKGRKIESYGRKGFVIGWSDYPDILVAMIDGWNGWYKDLATSGIYSDQELPDDGKYWYVLTKNII